jgi:spore maturation protein CgeB
MNNLKKKNCLVLSRCEVNPYMKFHVESFKDYFNNVIYFNYLDYFSTNGLTLLESEIDTIISRSNIDYVILWNWFTLYIPKVEFLQKLREKTFVVLWLFDDDVFFHTTGKYYAQASDAVVTTDYFGKIMYEQLSISSIYFAGAYDKNVYKPIETEQDIDVSFVGNLGKADRTEYVEYLINNGIKVEYFGIKSKRGYVTENEMIEIFNRSKINLNFSKIGFSTQICEDNPFISRVRQNKGRPIEIGLTRSFCLSESCPSLAKIFDIGEEIDVFNSKEELLEKVRLYLKNGDMRNICANNLYKKCLSQYEKDELFPHVFQELADLESKKNFQNLNYYGITKNDKFLVREMAFFLKEAIKQIMRKRKVFQLFDTIKLVFNGKPLVTFYAFFYMFRKHKSGKPE